MKDSVLYLQMICGCYGITLSVHPQGTIICLLQEMLITICILLQYNQGIYLMP